jgi:hypothetical protein
MSPSALPCVLSILLPTLAGSARPVSGAILGSASRVGLLLPRYPHITMTRTRLKLRHISLGLCVWIGRSAGRTIICLGLVLSQFAEVASADLDAAPIESHETLATETGQMRGIPGDDFCLCAQAGRIERLHVCSPFTQACVRTLTGKSGYSFSIASSTSILASEIERCFE